MPKEIIYTVKVDAYGTKSWYLNDKLHREDGPAVKRANGAKVWYLNGKLHREDGPAIERADGTKYWYLDGKDLTEQDFFKRTQRTQELTVAEIEKLIGYPIKIVKEK